MEHVEQVKTQIELEIYDSPNVIIKKPAPPIESSIEEKIEWIEGLLYNDFELLNYKSHNSLAAIMK
jgi:thymidylate synthase